ncbi:MAG: hypothetical protein V4463_13975 [Pseudomonadota bacterium]
MALIDPLAHAPLATGIFLNRLAGAAGFQFFPAGSDGTVALQLDPGRYQVDTVEPPGTEAQFLRKRYDLIVGPQGEVTMSGVPPDARGFHRLTLGLAYVATATPEGLQRRAKLAALANEPAQTFQPRSACQLRDQVTAERSFATDVSAGFPKVRIRLPSFGHIRALVVPVDFPDVVGKDKPQAFFGPIAAQVREFYLKQSYGKLSFDFEVLADWVRLPTSVTAFGFGGAVGTGDFSGYRNALIGVTDGLVDYSQYDAVYFLVPKEMPYERMGWGPAITEPLWTRTGYIINGATGGADMYSVKTIDGAAWKWMAHETGHALGLVDEDLQHASQTLGHWGIMAMNWSNAAIEHIGWDRYLQGWLGESQVACLPKDSLGAQGTRVALAPLVRQAPGVKLALVPLGEAKVLVIESRRSEGYDKIAPANQGVLVYTVDMRVGQLGGGYQTQRRQGSVERNFADAALHAGDSVTVDDVVVTVTGGGNENDTVLIMRKEYSSR